MKDISRREFIRDWLLPTAAGTALVLSGAATIATEINTLKGNTLEGYYDALIYSHLQQKVNMPLLAAQVSGLLKKSSVMDTIPSTIDRLNIEVFRGASMSPTTHLLGYSLQNTNSHPILLLDGADTVEEAAEISRQRFVGPSQTYMPTGCQTELVYHPIRASRQSLPIPELQNAPSAPEQFAVKRVPEDVLLIRRKYLFINKGIDSNGQHYQTRGIGQSITIFNPLLHTGPSSEGALLTYDWYEYSKNSNAGGVGPIKYRARSYDHRRARDIGPNEFDVFESAVDQLYKQALEPKFI